VNATFIGKPSHAAATPWEGINALDAATLSYTAIGLLRQHIRPSDRINVIMPEGGTAHNVIPERSRIRCNVRSETAAQMNALKAGVENCFKGAATATGCTMELSVA
jgi:metal-dependent amidase/aminoacylase/carboxypeptidase family protein